MDWHEPGKGSGRGEGNAAIYAVIALGVMVLAYAVYSGMQNGTLENNEENFVKYQQAAQLSAGGCGDLNDPGNLQHLSHHPERYQDCLRQADPVKFKQATGQELGAFLR